VLTSNQVARRSNHSNNIFAEWQPQYAALGIATFPVKDKKPCENAYQKIGLPGSAQLARKFDDANALGFMCGPRNRVTIVDIDSSDIRMVEEARKIYGQSPMLWRTGGSGHYAMPFRYNGETRSIRPQKDLPIDILGGGYAVLPPSIGTNSAYEFIRGSIDDFANLPPLDHKISTRPIFDGRRNNTLFKSLLRHAGWCDDFDSLLDVAMRLNMDCDTPLPDSEVVKITKSAWGYKISGRNWVGRKARASTDREEILSLSRYPGTLDLISLLRVSHPVLDDRFAIDQIKTARLLGWDRKALRKRITALVSLGHLTKLHHGKGIGDPHLYRLRKPK
jgi:hypothetical protein